MSNRRVGNMKTAADDPQSQVEQLLQAAEDDVLLKLRAGAHAHTHTASSTSSLDPDLARRFEALKSPPPPPPSAAPRRPSSEPRPAEKGGTPAASDGDGDWGKILGDGLAARFAALKGSSGTDAPELVVPEAKSWHKDDEDDPGDEDGDGVSKQEVDKLLQWAMDAARLDPSKSDDEEGGGDGASSVEEEEEEEEEEKKDLETKRKAGKESDKMNKGKPKKWFFF